MGIRSPRLLGKFARRNVAVFVLALCFAPTAFADNAGSVVTVGSTSVSAAVEPDPSATIATALPTVPDRPNGPTAVPVQLPISRHASLSAPTSVRARSSSSAASAPVQTLRTLRLSPTKRDEGSPRDSNATPVRQLTRVPAPTTAGTASTTSEPDPLALAAVRNVIETAAALGSSAFVVLLFFITTAIAAFRLPGFGRTVPVVLRPLWAHAPLLALERPD
jgi:hypothetical protein